MKTTLYILLLSLSSVCVQLQAQQKAQIELTNYQISKQKDSLYIDLTIQAKQVQLASDQSLRVELTLANADKQRVLPAIVYTGNKRDKYNRRAAWLSGEAQAAKRLVYKTIKGINKSTVYNVDYELTIPYEAWMDGASISFAQLFHDCCTESLVNTQTLIAAIDLKTIRTELPQKATTQMAAILTPDTSLCRQMVRILAAKSETVKERSSTIEVQIDYPKGVSKVMPMFGKNAQQLTEVDYFMKSVMDNELITLKQMLIVGYASPEGSYKSNEILAGNRSKAFKQYIIGRYRLDHLLIDTESVAEDWDGLVRLLNEKPSSYTPAVLHQINTYGIFEGREKRLMDLDGGIPYRAMLTDLFPKLRRLQLKASYVVANVSEQKAPELLYTHPELLSLEEIYNIANNSTQGTTRHQLVYEIAAKIYPNDALANNNAAAACLMNGDTVSALFYLNKLADNPIASINWGVYHYLLGNMEQTAHYWGMALQTESTRQQAETNISLLKDAKH